MNLGTPICQSGRDVGNKRMFRKHLGNEPTIWFFGLKFPSGSTSPLCVLTNIGDGDGTRAGVMKMVIRESWRRHYSFCWILPMSGEVGEEECSSFVGRYTWGFGR